MGLSTGAVEQNRKPQALAGECLCHSAVGSGTRFGATEGSCWFGPWELRVAFGWLACLVVPTGNFYYMLWPIRTKGPIRLGSDTAHHTGCCRDGSPFPPSPCFASWDPQNCVSTCHLYQKVSPSMAGLCSSQPSLRWPLWPYLWSRGWLTKHLRWCVHLGCFSCDQCFVCVVLSSYIEAPTVLKEQASGSQWDAWYCSAPTHHSLPSAQCHSGDGFF